jgi:hypothetical protein
MEPIRAYGDEHLTPDFERQAAALWIPSPSRGGARSTIYWRCWCPTPARSFRAGGRNLAVHIRHLHSPAAPEMLVALGA